MARPSVRILDLDAGIVQAAKPGDRTRREFEPARVTRDIPGPEAGVGHPRCLEGLLVEGRRSVVRPSSAHRSKGEMVAYSSALCRRPGRLNRGLSGFAFDCPDLPGWRDEFGFTAGGCPQHGLAARSRVIAA